MYRFFPQKRVASCSIITRDIRKDLVLLHRLGSRVVPELEIMTVIYPSNTKLRPQVKHARAAKKNDRCTGAARLL